MYLLEERRDFFNLLEPALAGIILPAIIDNTSPGSEAMEFIFL